MSDDFTGVMASMTSGSESSAGSPPAQESTAAETSVSLAESPASEAIPTADSGTTTAADPIEGQAVPYQRFREVNEARKRFEEQATKYSWAQDISADHGPIITQFYRDLRNDPIGTLIRESEALASSDPQQAQQLRSAAARWLGNGRGQQQAQAEAMPEADLQAQDGTLVYSAQQAQKLMDWRERRIMAQMSQTVQPLQQFAAKAQAEQMRGEIQANAKDWASKTFAQWSQRPHFTEHKRQIADLMTANPQMGLADAYAEVLTSVVLPKLSATERSNVVAAMHQKAGAGTTNPARGPASGQARPTSFSEAMRQLTGG